MNHSIHPHSRTREPFYEHHPVDDIEPEPDTEIPPRDAAFILRLLNNVMLTILRSGMSPLTFWQICYGIGLPICEGRSMTSVADELGVERAAISKGAKDFQRRNGLPINQYMKGADAVKEYSKKRLEQL